MDDERNPSPFARPRPGTQPPYLALAYRSTLKRAPKRAPIAMAQTLSELTGPRFDRDRDRDRIGADMTDLTRQHAGAPLGERIIVGGRILDEDGRAVPHTLVELWQCNAAGRYRHDTDRHDAPLDPNFTGSGQVLSDDEGAWRFVTIKPGAYPWRNGANAWRPAHLHLGVFGPGFASRLITQMYFPGDPLLPLDAIFMSVADWQARERLVAGYEPAMGKAEWALGYRFDIVLRGRAATPLETA